MRINVITIVIGLVAVLLVPEANARMDPEKLRKWQMGHLKQIIGAVKEKGRSHITRRRFARKWDTNKDWYIDTDEVPALAEYYRRMVEENAPTI